MINIKLEAMRDKLRKILIDKCITSEACEYAIDELLDLFSVVKRFKATFDNEDTKDIANY